MNKNDEFSQRFNGYIVSYCWGAVTGAGPIVMELRLLAFSLSRNLLSSVISTMFLRSIYFLSSSNVYHCSHFSQNFSNSLNQKLSFLARDIFWSALFASKYFFLAKLEEAFTFSVIFCGFYAMNTNHIDDAQISAPVDFGGKNGCDNRPQSKISNLQSFSCHCLKKPRSLGRYSPYTRIPIWVNRAKLSIPYKSELCFLFQKGRCFYGGNCHFAHKPSEIRKPGLKAAEMEEHVSERNAVFGGRECHYFSSGAECPYGDSCNFLHKCSHIFRRDGAGRNGLSDGSGNYWIDCSSLNGGQHYDKSIFHKTKLCAKWKDNFGSCPYGDKCTYAHGREELQKVGHVAELEDGRASRLMLYSQARKAGSCTRIKIAENLQMEEDEVHSMRKDISKISEIYADWIGVGLDFPVS